MPQVRANDINIEYDCFGTSGNPTVLLVMGLGTQMLAWRPRKVAYCSAANGREKKVA